jgi:hypothetical protein
MGGAMAAQNREQWIEKFEKHLLELRPKLLRHNAVGAIAASAWRLRGQNADDPVGAADDFSKMLDAAHAADSAEK